ncbi:MAG: N-acetylneuraminate synthase family protein [Phycisphaeraceae bacterium]|nr:N-acetylneuraminate synthase family protein [Phycisphaeraceae bacterium]
MTEISTIDIGRRRVGPGQPPYIIAELGVNHDGDPSRAIAMVDAAADAGADAVKTQCFRADLLMSGASSLAKYQEDAGERDPREMLRRLELDDDAMRAVVDRAHARGVHAIVTIFSLELVQTTGTMGWDAYKLASPDIVNRPLLDAVAALGAPLLLSTGAADLAEVERAAGWVREAGARERCAFFQCVSSYPAADADASLGAIASMRDALGAPVGYSDHTPSTDTGALAVCAGACMLEKHLTYDRSAQGPDHRASLDGAQFDEYVRLARRAHALLGGREKRALGCEADVRRVSRQSLVATRDLRAGAVIERADLTVKRPGVGVAPWRLTETVGRTLARAVRADAPIRDEDLV